MGKFVGLGVVGVMLLCVACQPASLPTILEPTVPPASSVPAPEKETAESDKVSEKLDLNQANVLFVRVTQTDAGTWRFDVTVRHQDEGWDHYADGWDVVTPDGVVLKTHSDDAFTRVLLHPHDTEQPFTRSQSGLVIPAGVNQVTVRAHCNVHGFGGKTVLVDLTAAAGPDFEVVRP